MGKTPHSARSIFVLKAFTMNQSTCKPLEFGPRQPHRILVVEQDPFLLHFNVEVLIGHGYEVETAEDGATAWKELQAVNYHLLITGYKLPKVTGIGLIKKLHAAHLALPVVLVAEKTPLHQLVKYPWLQPAATLLKPVAVDVLLDTVKNVLRATSSPLDNLADRASTITPMLQEMFEQGIELSHWGLND
jgi:DNA-binding response OmpR family regulator